MARWGFPLTPYPSLLTLYADGVPRNRNVVVLLMKGRRVEGWGMKDEESFRLSPSSFLFEKESRP